MTQQNPNLPADTILVLEDNVLLALDAAASATAAGYDVVMTARAGEALAMLDRVRLCGAILDFNLHDGNVTAVAERLTRAGIPFRVVSGHPPAVLQLAGIPRDVIISKPADYHCVMTSLTGGQAAA